MKKTLATAVAAVLVAGALTACDPKPTPEQLHPTYGGPSGECIEWDHEPCDDDPFDTDDDDIHLPKPSKKPTPRPMQTANQPKPRTTRR